MKKIIIMALMAVAILPTYAESTVTTIKADGLTNSEKKEKKEKNDTVRIRYIHRLTEDDARIFERNLQKTVIYVNDQVTTHLIMPENIKLVDISTDKLVGNQCADNIVRLKPKSTLMDNERRNGNGHRRAPYRPVHRLLHESPEACPLRLYRRTGGHPRLHQSGGEHDAG